MAATACWNTSAVIRWRKAFAAHTEPFGILRLELWLLAHRDERLRADMNAWQERVHSAFVALLDQQAADLGVTYRVDTALLATAVLAAGDGTAVAHGIDPAGNHDQAFAWALATLMVDSMEPRPISEEAWPTFVDGLLRAAGA